MIAGFISLVITIGIYWLAKRSYRLKPIVILSPLLITPVLLVLALIWTNTPYETYNKGGQWLSYMLQPATVAFAIPLYKHYAIIKKHAAEILVSVISGSAIAVISSAWIAGELHLDKELIYSMIPRSVTTPIAMNVSQMIGGIPAITAVFVIMTGVLGTVVGPFVIRVFRIRSDIARGVLLGTGAHGAGTSKAFEFSTISGTVSSVSMILAALITMFAAPWIVSQVISVI